MESKKILELIRKFNWSKLNRMYGCAHSPIIGFLSYEWLNLSESNSILDGVPSPIIGKGRTGQQNSDLLLCKNQKPYIPVEVETSVSKYNQKLQSLYNYIENFKSIEFGLLYMTNLTTGLLKYKHNWDNIKRSILNQVKNNSIVLISVVKEKIDFQNDNDWKKLLKRNDYSSWEINSIDCWICDKQKKCEEGNLWKK